MNEFVRELKESAAGLHDGMGGHADHCAELMEKAAKRIAEMEENATTQALALKAAKAMQQAETERADANERDAERYRWLRKRHWSDSTIAVVAVPKRSVKLGEDCPSEERLDAAIDQAMRNP